MYFPPGAVHAKFDQEKPNNYSKMLHVLFLKCHKISEYILLR